MAEALHTLDRLAATPGGHYVCVANVRNAILAQHDPEFCAIESASAMTVPDGMPLVWYARLAGLPQVDRVTGPDLMCEALSQSASRGYSHFFYGDTEEALSRLTATVRERYPKARIAGALSPPFRPLTDEELERDVRSINSARPTFVWVALGAPKQERWMARVAPQIEHSVLIGVGAAFRFLLGEYRHPPRVVQRLGLEGVCWRFLNHPLQEARWYARHIPAFGILMARLAVLRLSGCTPKYPL